MTSLQDFRKPLIWIAGLNVACLAFAYLFLFTRVETLAAWLSLPVLLLSVIQFIAGLVAMFKPPSRLAGILSSLAAPVIGAAGMLPLIAGMGAGWGRPLRIRGRQLHPALRKGSDWTMGDRPNVSDLDAATCRALAALWSHDAQKEHASVPAFSRISWLLAAVGAPADLVAWSHRAALEEVAHAQKCFALAAGYGGEPMTVQPMPDLLLGGLDCRADPLVTLATESVGDGCQLEDFNADVAGECARVCEDPVTRSVLEQIAREERSHAEFSWALLQWLLQQYPAQVRPAAEDSLLRLENLRRPTAVSWDKRRLVLAANETQLRRHGRIPDETWGELWAIRLTATRQRLGQLLTVVAAPARAGQARRL